MKQCIKQTLKGEIKCSFSLKSAKRVEHIYLMNFQKTHWIKIVKYYKYYLQIFSSKKRLEKLILVKIFRLAIVIIQK